VAVFADPVFSARDERVTRGPGPRPRAALPPELQRSASESGLRTLERLPATRQEAEAILGLVPKGAGLASLDFQANRTAAMDVGLTRYRIVHFATHGLFNSRHPELSGLVLSLVDASGQPQNGFLGVQDVFGMKLGADLVVLSACQTALGKDIRGEGLVGLTRGFMYAGAPRVVASLWKVSDRATAELMRRFYGALLTTGTPPAAALRKAQLELKRQRRFSAPYAWAAFTFEGEWR
jgi:CHAT domain-containing protein